MTLVSPSAFIGPVNLFFTTNFLGRPESFPIPVCLPIVDDFEPASIKYAKEGDIGYYPKEPWLGFYTIIKRKPKHPTIIQHPNATLHKELMIYRNSTCGLLREGFVVTGNIHNDATLNNLWNEEWEDIEFGYNGYDYSGWYHWPIDLPIYQYHFDIIYGKDRHLGQWELP